MIQIDTLAVLAQVAFGLAAISGMVMLLAGRSGLNSLDRARIAVLFQLTSLAFVLGILPMAVQISSIDEQENMKISSTAMAVLLGLSILLVRRTYAKARVEHGAQIKTGARVLFFGALGAQIVLAATVGAGLFESAGMAIYVTGLAVLLGLAFYQFLRLVGSEDLKRKNR